MHYSYTFQVYRFEKHHKGYLSLSQGTTFPFGIGFSATNQRRYYSKPDVNKLSEFIIDETLIKVGNDYMYGYGLLSSLLIRQSLVFASPLKEICLWLNSLYNL